MNVALGLPCRFNDVTGTVHTTCKTCVTMLTLHHFTNNLLHCSSNTFIAGALPVKDDPEVELPISDQTPAPALTKGLHPFPHTGP